MSIGLIGRKIGMTQIFDQDGNVIPVTVIEAGPCYILEQKTKEKHGYTAVLLGFIDQMKKKRMNKPQIGFFDKINVFPKKVLKEFRTNGETQDYQIGDQVKVDIFQQGDYIDVTGTTKGRGFQGTVKRHNTTRGPMAHGSRYHRRPGSMGACADPSRVFKGKRLPGRMGGTNCKMQNLKIIDIKHDDNILLVKGAIPGANDNIVLINKAKKKSGK